MSAGTDRPLRPGDTVAVRSPDEILATLDEHGALDGVPFMPEMLRHVGRRFTVSRRVEKICDTIAMTGSRRLHHTVFLEDLRCDGSGHGGCQAGCRIYWKEAWLRRVEDDDGAAGTSAGATAQLDEVARAGARVAGDVNVESEDGEVWRCQATEAVRATTPMKTSDVRQYWREIRSGNIGVLHFLRVAVRAFLFEIGIRIGRVDWSPLRNHGAQQSREPLDVQPGERVRVRSESEIAETLDPDGRNRGLSFDREMLPYCGGTYRVKDRVRQIIDERTGRMIHIGRDCVILDGVICSGERSIGRWFCPREIYPYWRESWLERTDETLDSGGHQSGS